MVARPSWQKPKHRGIKFSTQELSVKSFHSSWKPSGLLRRSAHFPRLLHHQDSGEVALPLGHLRLTFSSSISTCLLFLHTFCLTNPSTQASGTQPIALGSIFFYCCNQNCSALSTELPLRPCQMETFKCPNCSMMLMWADRDPPLITGQCPFVHWRC